uniref:Uncharacterized protein n=1 Tax=Tetranychus urticae TaxID=32264 RepID=T1JWX7_TETUR
MNRTEYSLIGFLTSASMTWTGVVFLVLPRQLCSHPGGPPGRPGLQKTIELVQRHSAHWSRTRTRCPVENENLFS